MIAMLSARVPDAARTAANLTEIIDQENYSALTYEYLDGDTYLTPVSGAGRRVANLQELTDIENYSSLNYEAPTDMLQSEGGDGYLTPASCIHDACSKYTLSRVGLVTTNRHFI